jgi:hypothetical protein
LLKFSNEDGGSGRKKLIEVWQWRLSSSSEYCSVCKKNLKKRSLLSDCDKCNYVCPEILRQNSLFIRVYTDCQYSRDFYGRIDYNVFLKVMDLYGSILGIENEDKLILIRKLGIVSELEEEHRKTLNNKPTGTGNNDHRVIGKR